MQALPAVFDFSEGYTKMPVGDVRGQEIKTLVIGFLNTLSQMLTPFGDDFGAGLYLRHDPKVKRGRTLRIEIAKEGWRTRLRRHIGEVHGRCGFTHTAFGMKNSQRWQVVSLMLKR